MTEDNRKINVRDIIKADDEFLNDISGLIESHSTESLLNILRDLHSADIAEIINHLNADDATYLFRILDTETASEVITEVDENLRETILNDIDASQITDIVDELDVDDATDIVADLPDNIAEHVLDNIDSEYSADVKELLKYPEDSAGGIMNSDYISIDENATVRDAIEEIKKNSDEVGHIYHLYVVRIDGELIGTVPIKLLLINTPGTKVSSLIEEDLIYVTPDIDQEEVAKIMEKYDLVAVPVVDDNKNLLGRITIDDIVDVINEEAAEDIQKIAGLSEDEELSYSAYRVSGNRLPWLLVALFGELISAYVLSAFHATMEQMFISGIFIPVVMAMGGSSSAQSSVVVVRGLATGEIWIGEVKKRLIKEFKVAVINGLICGLILAAATQFLWHQDLKFSIILSLSILIIMINATMVGATVPLLLNKLDIDPAISTGFFVSTANDILGLIIYFSLLSIFYFS
ncbi:MAG: magnesium transporter [Bacteroidota bacterium]